MATAAIRLQNPFVTEKGVLLRGTSTDDIPHVQELLRKVPDATLGVSEGELKSWSEAGLSKVAVMDGNIVGHQAVTIWPLSKWAEFRSAVVDKDQKGPDGAPLTAGKNINHDIKKHMIDGLIANHPEVPVIVVVKNSSSNGTSILYSLGFKDTPEEQVPSELLTIGEGQKWKFYTLDVAEYKASHSA